MKNIKNSTPVKSITVVFGILLLALSFLAACAKERQDKPFRWAGQTAMTNFEPHWLQTTFRVGMLGQVYEALIAFDEDLKIQPGLSTSWESISPTEWVFELRQGVSFHNGSVFNADDVVYSFNRSKASQADKSSAVDRILSIVALNDYTVKITTAGPDISILNRLTNFYIVDEEWIEENNAQQVASPSDAQSNFAVTNANGTGPFKLGVIKDDQVTFIRSDNYWDSSVSRDFETAIYTTISESGSRVAALLSDQVDVIYPVATQDWETIESNGFDFIKGLENRILFLGFDQWRDQVLGSNVEGNPFKDIRVREAFNIGIDRDAILKNVLRNSGKTSSIMLDPAMLGYNSSLEKDPYVYDEEKAKRLLTEAGYPNGFPITLHIPNDRYFQDEEIGKAIAVQLSKIGIQVNLVSQTRALHFQNIYPPDYNTSFYMLGWGNPDGLRVVNNLLSCRTDIQDERGRYNIAGYCNPQINELSAKIEVSLNNVERNQYIAQAVQIAKADYAYIPLFVPPLAWASNKDVRVAQRPDNVLDLRWAYTQ